jgi:hypothetical protein
MLSTAALNAASKGAFELSQWWTRQGLSLCENKMRWTD